MDKPFLSAYSRLLIKTCHKRGAFAMGGMAAFIPSKDTERNRQVLSKVTADKELEANNGHDGTWIAHPGLADTAMAVFDRVLGDKPNQLSVTRSEDAPITAEQLLAPCEGGTHGSRNARQHSRGGAVHRSVDLRQRLRTDLWPDGRRRNGRDLAHLYLAVDPSSENPERRYPRSLRRCSRQWLAEELMVIQEELGEHRFSHGRFDDAARLMEQITTSDELIDFLTLPGYRLLA